jgi:cytochrome c peroxidase
MVGGASRRFALHVLTPFPLTGANAGLALARSILEPIKAKYGERLSYADLWSLAGVAAIQEMGGPNIPWRAGRADAVSGEACTPDGRLPDATKQSDHLRAIFYRMGFTDQEIVALSGAHALGRCHTDRSGFEGPWTFSPTTFTNDYYIKLLKEKWVDKTVKATGNKQFVDKASGSLMMLPSDLALVKDKAFKSFVDLYAKDGAAFSRDFARAFTKLGELGVPFPVDAKTWNFARSE